MRTAYLASLTLATVTVPRFASAQTAPPPPPSEGAIAAPTTVHPPAPTVGPNENVFAMRDGSVLHGRVIDLRPGQYVVIAQAGEQSRTIAWFDIVRADGPSFPGGYVSSTYAPTSNGLGTMAPTENEYLHPSSGRVPVVFESPQEQQQIGEVISLGGSGGSGGGMYMGAGGSMYMNGGGGGGLAGGVIGRTICNTPCTLYVPQGVFTVTAGARRVRTVAVSVDVPPTGLRVRLRHPSNATYVGGLIALASGIFVTLGSTGLYVVGAMRNSSYYSSGSGTGYFIGGAVMTGAGIALIASGIVLLSGARGGIEASAPLAPSPQVTVGPIIGGLSVGVSSQF